MCSLILALHLIIINITVGWFILKFADDTVFVSLLTKDGNCHGPVVNDFMTCV